MSHAWKERQDLDKADADITAGNLVVTSPPYDVGKKYDTYWDQKSVDAC